MLSVHFNLYIKLILNKLFARWNSFSIKLTKGPKLFCIVLPLLTPPLPPLQSFLFSDGVAVTSLQLNFMSWLIAKLHKSCHSKGGLPWLVRSWLYPHLPPLPRTRGLLSGAAYLRVKNNFYTPAAYISGRLIIRRLRYYVLWITSLVTCGKQTFYNRYIILLFFSKWFTYNWQL